MERLKHHGFLDSNDRAIVIMGRDCRAEGVSRFTNSSCIVHLKHLGSSLAVDPVQILRFCLRPCLVKIAHVDRDAAAPCGGRSVHSFSRLIQERIGQTNLIDT
jgi:hypothetical protein